MVKRGKGFFDSFVKPRTPVAKSNMRTFVVDSNDLNEEDRRFLKRFGYGVTRRVPKYFKVSINPDLKSTIPVVW